MGKISPISIKYTIYAKFEANGVVEKPDVIGAIFGQTEGLLGEELELRDLQKNGKIGRIDVNLKTENSKTEGEIIIPTSLDKAETTIIAAAIETIERIGPCDTKVSVQKIEDVRVSKREYVLGRAKELLAGMSSPDSREIQTAVSESVKAGKIIEYGEEKLPAGPDMDNEEIIVVEGRADVVNLLRYGIKNAIAMNGTSLPKTITELGKTKRLILFIDGDRGGILIAKDAIANANISAVCQAPQGMEVEELTGKDILASLRAKMSVDEFIKEKLGSKRREKRSREKLKIKEKKEEYQYTDMKEKSESEVLEVAREKIKEIEGTRTALLLDNNLKSVRKVSSDDLTFALRNSRVKIYAIILDGLATNAMIKTAERIGCKYFIAKNFSVSEETKINLLSL
ncbi:MAG: DNA primase DnaG [Candidatus Pacearchaeota archaeon]